MGRRSSSSSGKSKAKEAKSCESPPSVVSKLRMLRDFVGTATWSETDLSSCLRQCGYNAELAAERLMTGQFQGSNQAIQSGPRKSAFFTMSTSSSSKGSGTETINVRNPTVTSLTVKRTRETPQSSRKKVARASTGSSSTAKVVTPVVSSSSSKGAGKSNVGPLLLCQRWVVGCCTTRHGHVAYKEKLSISNSMTGPPVVRFRGFSIDGTLPANLGALLTPLLRYDQKLISIKAEGLMEARQVPIGGEVPLALSIYLEAPLEFFQIFEQEKESSKGNSMMFFGKKQHHSKLGNSSKMKLSEAAFALLQWAEYGDVPEFQPPADEAPSSGKKPPDQLNNTDDGEEGEDLSSMIILREDEIDAVVADDDDDTTKSGFSQLLTNGSDQTASLPEMEDPAGFTDGVVLRSYQRQALHWMVNRENNLSQREGMEKELSLLLELVRHKPKAPSTNWADGSQEDIRCECGPVIVSDKAAKQSMTLDGQVDPVNHPLWQRRFLASADMDMVISYYVNELLGTATHRPPNPPRQCVGGILADSMGLGKTVMLLALILKEKEEAAKNNFTIASTLIVAPLSLISQWEDELSTKTSLTYSVHYGDKRATYGSSNHSEVDVVVTTYGTVQGELQTRVKKNATSSGGNGLLDYEWFRVILDEAHCIKNQTTLACKACCMLKAERRWCVSGTIIQNSLDDVYALLKFLRHEPWCESGFWKAAVTTVMRSSEPEAQPDEAAAATPNTETLGLNVAMDRVRRLLLPIMLRRTKDSLSKDGTPILTLPPVETSVVPVLFSPAEREFYNALLLKSQDVFEGYVKAGTASKSWFAIFSLLHRLRQACDHVALTVKSHMDESEWIAPRSLTDDKEVGTTPSSCDAVNDEFLKGLLKKFGSKQQASADHGEGSNVDSNQETAYVKSVAKSLTDAVKKGDTMMTEECPICLDIPLIQDAVVTPCAHVFCKACLVGHLRDKASDKKSSSQTKASSCPNGECPCCNKVIDASRIIALSQSSRNGQTTSSFLGDQTLTTLGKMPPSKTSLSAREFLEQSLRGAGSSKLAAVLLELHNVWKVDPGSKVLIFSQFLGFLDLMEGALRENSIPFGRLDGRLSLKERVTVLEDFKKSPLCSSSPNKKKDSVSVAVAAAEPIVRGSVLLISMKAGGVGINLVAASSVFIVDPWWNAAVEDQCVNRIHRIGQTADVVRVRKFVVQDSVEERIVQLQHRKKGIANEVFGDAALGKDGSSPDAARPTLDDMRLIFGK